MSSSVGAGAARQESGGDASAASHADAPSITVSDSSSPNEEIFKPRNDAKEMSLHKLSKIRHLTSSSSMLNWRSRSMKDIFVGDLHILLRYGEHSIQGKRETQEDSSRAFTDVTKDTSFLLNDTDKSDSDNHFAFFGVFDGHGGREASEFASKTLHRYLAEEKLKNPNLKEALKEAFRRVEADFMKKAHEKDLMDGSTASVAVINGRQLIAATVGDSELVLCRGESALPLCDVHNPKKNPAEIARVTKAGGIIRFDRLGHPKAPLNYSLAVSRALGDMPFKHSDFTKGVPSGLIADPDVKEYSLTPLDQFLIIACDGLWDVMTHQEAVDFCLSRLRVSDDPQLVSEELVNEAYDRGSTDNISVQLITFKHFKTPQLHATK